MSKHNHNWEYVDIIIVKEKSWGDIRHVVYAIMKCTECPKVIKRMVETE